MAKKLIDLEEAARMLGVSVDTLGEMRSRHELTAYRDGASWKFKAEEIEKLAKEREAAESDLSEMDDQNDSILLSEVEMGDSPPSTLSTIIGKSNAPSPDSDIHLAGPGSDLHLAAESDLHLSGLGSNVLPTESPPPSPSASDIHAAPPSDGGADSNLDTLLISDAHLGGSGLSAKFDELDTLDLDLPSPKDSGIGLGSSGLRKAASGSDLSLDDDALSLGEADDILLGGSSKKGGSDKQGGSTIELAVDEDDEFVLGGSSGSDITGSAGDSGISLMDPSDSGLSLDEQPMELGGSAVESLELGEDDMLAIEDQVLAPAGSGKGSGKSKKSDDEFLLTPLDEGGSDESDSGSQVIALDPEGDFEESGATLVASEPTGSLFEEEVGEGLSGGLGLSAAADLSPGAGLGMGMAGGTVMPAARAPQSTYTVWNILALTLPACVLAVVGMMMFDLVRNMWSWNGPYQVNGSLMEKISSWFG